MSASLRTAAAFKCDRFNTTQQRPEFINPDCFGDDVGQWLIDGLRRAGHRTDDAPGAEDFGWYVRYSVSGADCCAVIGYAPDEGWFIVVENDKGLLGSIFGGRHRAVSADGVMAIHKILSESADIKDLRWYSWKEFQSRQWLDSPGSPTPTP
jgi:hypothetical protein